MTGVKCDTDIDSAMFADETCRHLLRAAGMHDLWEPEVLPESIIDLAAKVLYLADVAPTDDLTASELDTVDGFCNVVIEEARSLFDKSQTPKRAPFRVNDAMLIGEGNCAAFHEAVSGVLRAAGLTQFCIGEWMGNHARTGLLIGNRRIFLDGYDKTVIKFDPASAEDLRKQAWENALNTGDINVMRLDNDGNAASLEEVEIGNINTIVITKSVALTMPASSLVLMIAAARAGRGHSAESSLAQSLLGPLAPIL